MLKAEYVPENRTMVVTYPMDVFIRAGSQSEAIAAMTYDLPSCFGLDILIKGYGAVMEKALGE